jgi:hypothetical protein
MSRACICDRPLLAHTGGKRPDRTALRDAIKIWLWQHTQKYPRLWFTPVELARVIAEQYACEPQPWRVSFWGRGRTVISCLEELETLGDVIRSDDGTQWKAAPA